MPPLAAPFPPQSGGKRSPTPRSVTGARAFRQTHLGFPPFTCSGAGCALEQGTQYFVHIWASTGSVQAARVNTTLDNDETLQPSSNGWSIADSVNYSGNDWLPIMAGRSLKIKVIAVPK